MTQYRQDLITGRWVIVAKERARRPAAFLSEEASDQSPLYRPEYVENCPFCYGNEEETPPEEVVWREEDTLKNAGPTCLTRWKVRVVPNKFPAVEPHNHPEMFSALPGFLYRGMPGFGVHEVIIETPLHNRHPGDLTRHQTELILEAYLHRLRFHAHNPNLKYVQLFRNHLREAGASLEHPHSQMVGLPFLPGEIQREMDGSYRFFLREGRCPYCSLIQEELSCGERIVYQAENFVALVPYAARVPFETWILPRRHRSAFSQLLAEEIGELAEVFQKVLGGMARSLNHPPYNLFLHTAPLREDELPGYHWHLEILPRLANLAGFEMGSGVYINVTPPEEAAAYLRSA